MPEYWAGKLTLRPAPEICYDFNICNITATQLLNSFSSAASDDIIDQGEPKTFKRIEVIFLTEDFYSFISRERTFEHFCHDT